MAILYQTTKFKSANIIRFGPNHQNISTLSMAYKHGLFPAITIGWSNTHEMHSQKFDLLYNNIWARK